MRPRQLLFIDLSQIIPGVYCIVRLKECPGLAKHGLRKVCSNDSIEFSAPCKAPREESATTAHVHYGLHKALTAFIVVCWR